MDNRDTLGIIDDTHLERLPVRGRADEHRGAGIARLEASPLVSKSMQHAVVGDIVLAGARLDVHLDTVKLLAHVVNIC